MLTRLVPQVLDAQSDRRWPDDDLKDDFTTLRDALSQNVVELSSWEVYLRELSSGTLSWSPVHRSERFWKENALRFEEHNSAVLRQLINVLAVCARFHGSPFVSDVAGSPPTPPASWWLVSTWASCLVSIRGARS
jgi:hypothetical protein